MSLFKCNDSSYWWVRFIHDGRRIQHSTRTADQAKAQAYRDKLKASLWDQERLGVKPRRTWNDEPPRESRRLVGLSQAAMANACC